MGLDQTGRALVVLLLATLSSTAGSASARCGCDCDEDGRVRVPELVHAVLIAQGQLDVSTCPAALDDDCPSCGAGVHTLVGCVRNALDGCPPSETFSPEPSTTATATPAVSIAKETPTPTPTDQAPELTPGIDGLRFVEVLRDGDGDIDGMRAPVALGISPDGRHVYVVSNFERSLVIFERDGSSVCGKAISASSKPMPRAWL